MPEHYQLLLTQNKSFQDKLDDLLARLAKVDGVRLSKRRLVHAGVTSIRNATFEDVIRWDSMLELFNGRSHPNHPPKHAAVQIDRAYADLARLKSAQIAVAHNFRRPTRNYIHFGLMSLSDSTSEEFDILIRASIVFDDSARKADT